MKGNTQVGVIRCVDPFNENNKWITWQSSDEAKKN